MTKVKVCGMTSLADAEHAASHGAWAIGLIHHPDSPRFVAPDVAEEIGAALKRRCEIAGVFVNSTLQEVIERSLLPRNACSHGRLSVGPTLGA